MPDLTDARTAIAALVSAAVPDAYVRWEKQPRGYGKPVDVSLDTIAISNLGLTPARFARAYSPTERALTQTQHEVKRMVVRIKAEATEAKHGYDASDAIEAIRDYLRGPVPHETADRVLSFVDATPSVDLTYTADRRTVPAAYIDAIFYALVTREREALPTIETVITRTGGGYGAGYGVGYA